jgi:5'-3' exonuclease
MRLLIIDCMNLYLRSYIVDPSLSLNGNPIGGLRGFLKTFQKICRETKPDKVVLAWDGAGGSKKRRSVDKNYKSGRKPLRLNREIRNLSESEEIYNKFWQQVQLIEYLNLMPVSQLMFDGVEADDIIAFVSQNQKFSEWQKVIVSSDKDFYQLCDDKTIIYRPAQKEILNKKDILSRHKIHPNNFVLARALSGDRSDGIKGVGGAGLKTVSKRFPFLLEEDFCTIEQLIEFCSDIEKPLIIHKNIINNGDVIKKNYKMMQLSVPSLSAKTCMKINYILDNSELIYNRTELKKMMLFDGFGDWDHSDLDVTFNRLLFNQREIDRNKNL